MRFMLIGGTADSRELAREIYRQGHQLLISTLTEYGAELAYQGSRRWEPEDFNGQNNKAMPEVEIRYGALNEDSFTDLLRTRLPDAVVDAAHPYAQQIHALAEFVCRKEGVPYFIWERPSAELPESGLIYGVKNLREAAASAAKLGRRILLTTGGNSLPEWLQCEEFKEKEIFVRVLPTSGILAQCEALGLKPYQIIAAQGPFSQSWNEAIFEQLEIDVVVAKDSGLVGGTPEKIAACMNTGIPIVILQRPQMPKHVKGSSSDLRSFINEMEEKLK